MHYRKWYDLEQDKGVLELNIGDNPTAEIELILSSSPEEDVPLRAAWIHSETGRTLWFPLIGEA